MIEYDINLVKNFLVINIFYSFVKIFIKSHKEYQTIYQIYQLY